MRSPATTLMLALGSAASPDATAAPLCSAESDPQMPAVVELYTSEGCSSCPRADRWLWTLTGRPGVLALAFHVNYWDHLGWSDRFATAEGTARQRALARAAGQLSIYTPQVRVNGHDTRAGMPLPAPKPSTLRLTVESDGSEVQVRVAPAATGVPARLAGWWVVGGGGRWSCQPRARGRERRREVAPRPRGAAVPSSGRVGLRQRPAGASDAAGGRGWTSATDRLCRRRSGHAPISAGGRFGLLNGRRRVDRRWSPAIEWTTAALVDCGLFGGATA